jgi:hypothetical protein
MQNFSLLCLLVGTVYFTASCFTIHAQSHFLASWTVPGVYENLVFTSSYARQIGWPIDNSSSFESRPAKPNNANVYQMLSPSNKRPPWSVVSGLLRDSEDEFVGCQIMIDSVGKKRRDRHTHAAPIVVVGEDLPPDDRKKHPGLKKTSSCNKITLRWFHWVSLELVRM